MTSKIQTLVPLPLALLCATAVLAQNREQLRNALADAPRNLPWTEANIRSKSLFNAGSEKIDPALLAVASQVHSKGLDSLEKAASEYSVRTQDDMIAIALLAEDESDVTTLRKEVAQRGGRVTTTYKNEVYALLPPDQISSLDKIDSLYSATRPNRYSPSQEEDKDAGGLEGVLKIKADRLHKAGVRGQGVKVGVLDFGFQKYDQMKAAGKVPQPVQAKAFTQTGQLDVNTTHGTACVEIIHAMAPDAQIYIAAVDGDENQIIDAARWLSSQGVEIISFSGGGNWGPHNGTALLDQLVDEITHDHKILWVNAAGNEAQSHLLIQFPGGAPGWIPAAADSPFVAIQSANQQIFVYANWDDWGTDPQHPSGTQDIDLALFHIDKASGQPELIAKSDTQQNGHLPPLELINANNVTPGEIYWLGLWASHVAKPVRVHVYLDQKRVPEQMLPVSAIGSVGIPATSPAALSVGAVNVQNDKLEDYSSRGPTDDNRAKPELSSYDNVSSASSGKNFTGTSAACPHVAGLAALFKSQNHSGDAPALRAKLMSSLRRPASDEPGFGSGITDVSEPGGAGKADELPTTSLELPEYFGGTISASALEKLGHNDDQPFTVKVRLGRDGNPPVYHIGDDLRVGFTTEEDSYCTLVNRNASGGYTVLPLETERLEGGKKYVYPDQITVSEPTGSEKFLFFCSKERVDLNREGQARGLVAVDVADYEVKP